MPITADEAEVLAQNDAFYAAFNGKDSSAMAALWATQAPCVCLHPGASPLHGRDAVVGSWRSILGSTSAPHINIDAARVVMLGETAMVLCYEHVHDKSGQHAAVLAATNVFVREDGGWKMVHHHASALGRVVREERSPRTLN